MNTLDYAPEAIETYQDTAVADAMRKALAEVRGQMGRNYPLIIGGEAVDTTQKIVSTNPSNPAQVIGQGSKAGKAEADAALEVAWKAFPAWKNQSQAVRSRIIMKAAEIMKRRQRELEAWLVYEIGKNWGEAAGEVAEAIDFLRYYAIQGLKHQHGAPTTPYPGEDNSAFYIPLGVGLAITPWNFPLAIVAGMTVAPIVVGNCVITKPSEDAFVTAAKLFEILEEAGLPPGVANYLPGDGAEVGAYLVEHPRTRFINFTGSLEVGLRINEAAAKAAPGQIWIKRVFMELGGKDGLVVDETANLKAAATATIQSAFGFQGQKCSACSRLIVVDKVHDALLDQIITQAKALTVGPADENPNLGPVVSTQQEETVRKYIDIGKQEGKLLVGGQRLEGNGFFFSPTIFGELSPSSRMAQEEIFGPVLSVLRVPDFEAALEVANGTRFGLTGGLFSGRRDRLERARNEFHVGNLYFNRKITGAFVGVQPFGGFNSSGTDTKAGGPDYLLNFLQMKSVTERL
jgi:1-pyrroline-5-carboxylate dehydrogenase